MQRQWGSAARDCRLLIAKANSANWKLKMEIEFAQGANTLELMPYQLDNCLVSWISSRGRERPKESERQFTMGPTRKVVDGNASYESKKATIFVCNSVKISIYCYVWSVNITAGCWCKLLTFLTVKVLNSSKYQSILWKICNEIESVEFFLSVRG